MQKIIKILFFLLFVTASVKAQQDAMYSQYVFNMMAINPAYTGNRNVVSTTGHFRSQWSGLEGAPKTGMLTVQAPISRERIGLGVQLFSDKLGVTTTNGFTASAAYHIALEDDAKLSFGLQGNAWMYRSDLASSSLENQGYDPAFSQNLRKTLLNLGTGVFYHTDKFYAGISVQDMLANRLNDDSELSATQVPHFFATTGYVFPLDDSFKLKPSILVKATKGAPLEADINATLWIKDFISVGALYRTNADISGMLGVQVSPEFFLGYSYDYSTTALRAFNSGSHEIVLRYEFRLDRLSILSPRFF